MTTYPLIPSPLPFHVLFALSVFILWIFYRRRLQLVTPLTPIERRKINLCIGVITLLSATGFILLIFYAFTTRCIAGYKEIEEWEWLKTLYSYEAIYVGEWYAFFYLYFFPLLIAIAFSVRFAEDERSVFQKCFFYFYPFLLLISYSSLFLCIILSSLDTNREKTDLERTQQFSVYRHS